jgi:hypothetical protein
VGTGHGGMQEVTGTSKLNVQLPVASNFAARDLGRCSTTDISPRTLGGNGYSFARAQALEV